MISQSPNSQPPTSLQYKKYLTFTQMQNYYMGTSYRKTQRPMTFQQSFKIFENTQISQSIVLQEFKRHYQLQHRQNKKYKTDISQEQNLQKSNQGRTIIHSGKFLKKNKYSKNRRQNSNTKSDMRDNKETPFTRRKSQEFQNKINLKLLHQNCEKDHNNSLENFIKIEKLQPKKYKINGKSDNVFEQRIEINPEQRSQNIIYPQRICTQNVTRPLSSKSQLLHQTYAKWFGFIKKNNSVLSKQEAVLTLSPGKILLKNSNKSLQFKKQLQRKTSFSFYPKNSHKTFFNTKSANEENRGIAKSQISFYSNSKKQSRVRQLKNKQQTLKRIRPKSCQYKKTKNSSQSCLKRQSKQYIFNFDGTLQVNHKKIDKRPQTANFYKTKTENDEFPNFKRSTKIRNYRQIARNCTKQKKIKFNKKDTINIKPWNQENDFFPQNSFQNLDYSSIYEDFKVQL